MNENMGETRRRIDRALQAVERAYAWTAFPAETAGAVVITGFVALVLADAWAPGFTIPDQGRTMDAAAAWMLAAIWVYMLYAPCRYMETRHEPETVTGWRQAAWNAALYLPLALIASGIVMATQWDSPAVETAAGYTLFAGLALAALRTAAGLAARIRRKLDRRNG